MGTCEGTRIDDRLVIEDSKSVFKLSKNAANLTFRILKASGHFPEANASITVQHRQHGKFPLPKHFLQSGIDKLAQAPFEIWLYVHDGSGVVAVLVPGQYDSRIKCPDRGNC